MSRWWVASVVLHAGAGVAVNHGWPSHEARAPESPLDEVRFLPPPIDAPRLVIPKEDDRVEAAERQRTQTETRPEHKPPETEPTRGLAGRVGAIAEPTQATLGAAPVKSQQPRRHKPARRPPVTKAPPVKTKPVPLQAADIDFGKARDAAQRTLDQFVGRLTPEEAMPEEQVFASLAELAAAAPAIGDLPRVGRRGTLRRRAVSTRPPGQEGLGATGATDIVRVGDTLRMDADLMRRHPYWKAVYDKVQPLWRFPREAEERKLQGEVHIAFRFHPETGVVTEFEVVRRSRVEGFDDNVIEAVRRAAPFGAVPADAPSAGRIVWPFKFRNPLF